MALTVADLKFVRLRSDPAETPAAMQQFDGMMVGADPAAVQPLPTRPRPDAKLWGVPGYARVAADGVTEWVMTDTLDPTTKQLVRAIPPGGWADTAARKTFMDLALTAIQRGITPADTVTLLQQAYAAAVANAAAQPPGP